MSRHRSILRERSVAAGALQAERVWVQVVAEDGSHGLGRTSFGAPVVQFIRHVFAPLLIGLDADAIELHNDLMWRASLRAGAEGHAAFARSAIDLALWDLKGKRLGMPVYRLLGGPVRETLHCYATSDDLDWAQELGFDAFKVSNPVHHDDGTAGLERAEEKVAAARASIGPDADLMFNPIMSFNVDFSVRLANRLRPHRLAWMEEPLQPWDLEGMAQLRRRAPFLSLATGEDHHGRHAFAQLIEARCVDVVQPDLEWCGGLTEAVKIHSIAEAAGLDVSPHVGANTPWGQHFGIAMANVAVSEYWLGTDPGVPLEDTRRIPGTPVPVSGRLTPSDAPGFGLDIEEAWLKPI